VSGAIQPPMRMPGIPGSMPPNTLGQGMPPPGTPTMMYSPHAGTQVSTPSKIDPTQIPRPMTESSVIIYETRQGGQANIPPVCFRAHIVHMGVHFSEFYSVETVLFFLSYTWTFF
jgi:protein transport protein SEC24